MSKNKNHSFKDTKERKFLPEEVFQHLDKETHYFENENVKMTSIRYKLFSTKGCTCVKCGKVGTHFKLERKGCERYHFNLYSDDGILFTKDHIIPKSRGGRESLANFQTMCYKCNNNKSNSYTKEEAKMGEIKKGWKIKSEGDTKTLTPEKLQRKRINFTINEIKELRFSVLLDRNLINEYMREHHINCYEHKESMPKEIQDAMQKVIESYTKIIESYSGKISASAKEVHGLPKSETIKIIEKVKENILLQKNENIQ